jgi:hypothetical protein
MPNVFLSVGRPSSAVQAEFLERFVQFLATRGLDAKIVGKNYFKNQQPLRSIQECMADCAGVVILAWERTFIASGEERRGSPERVDRSGARLPTIWNQVEAALALGSQLPLLVVVERGLHLEGLLAKTFDWYVKEVDLSSEAFQDRELGELVDAWKLQMAERQPSASRALNAIGSPPPAEKTIAQLMGELKTSHLWSVIVAIVTALAVVGGFAFHLGQLNLVAK